MTLAQRVLRLPRSEGKAVYDFLFAPAASAHPDRIGLPEPLRSAGPAVRALALAAKGEPAAGNVDGLPELINWRSPDHRTAILPAKVLETLAWYLGLAAYAGTLRRVVLRDELMALNAAGIGDSELQFVYSLPAPDPQLTDTEPVSVLAGEGASSRVWRAGWTQLIELAGRLPAPIGARFRLKLPFVETEAAERPPSMNEAAFAHVRKLVMDSMLPQFDESLESLAA
jgi:hypothetical protein